MSKSLDRSDIAQLVEAAITSARKKPLTFAERQFFVTKFKEIDLDKFATHPIKQVITALVTILSEDLKVIRDEDMSAIDIREMQIAEIGTEAESAVIEKKVDQGTTLDSLLQDPRTLQRIFNPEATLRRAYLVLDSRYRNRVSGSQQIFSWNVSTPSGNYDTNTTALTTIPLHDVVKIKVYPFRFPNTDNANTNSHRLSIEIIEFNQQAMITHNNKRAHFLLDIERTGAVGSNSPYELKDVGNSIAEYIFHTPIVDINTVSLRFGNPLQNVTLDPDQLPATLSAVGVQTLLTFAQPHYCATIDDIFILDFTTTNPAADRVQIDQINSINGWSINVPPSPVPTATTMLIDVDLSGLVGTIVAPTQVYLNAKRILCRIEFTYITSDPLGA
jgi:hypothetical protein